MYIEMNSLRILRERSIELEQALFQQWLVPLCLINKMVGIYKKLELITNITP